MAKTIKTKPKSIKIAKSPRSTKSGTVENWSKPFGAPEIAKLKEKRKYLKVERGKKNSYRQESGMIKVFKKQGNIDPANGQWYSNTYRVSGFWNDVSDFLKIHFPGVDVAKDNGWMSADVLPSLEEEAANNPPAERTSRTLARPSSRFSLDEAVRFAKVLARKGDKIGLESKTLSTTQSGGRRESRTQVDRKANFIQKLVDVLDHNSTHRNNREQVAIDVTDLLPSGIGWRQINFPGNSSKKVVLTDTVFASDNVQGFNNAISIVEQYGEYLRETFGKMDAYDPTTMRDYLSMSSGLRSGPMKKTSREEKRSGKTKAGNVSRSAAPRPTVPVSSRGPVPRERTPASERSAPPSALPAPRRVLPPAEASSPSGSLPGVGGRTSRATREIPK